MLWKSCLRSGSVGDYFRSSADLITLFINHTPDYDEYTGKLLGIKKHEEYGQRVKNGQVYAHSNRQLAMICNN